MSIKLVYFTVVGDNPIDTPSEKLHTGLSIFTKGLSMTASVETQISHRLATQQERVCSSTRRESSTLAFKIQYMMKSFYGLLLWCLTWILNKIITLKVNSIKNAVLSSGRTVSMLCPMLSAVLVNNKTTLTVVCLLSRCFQMSLPLCTFTILLACAFSCTIRINDLHHTILISSRDKGKSVLLDFSWIA